MNDNSKLESWKLAVARSSSYIQSNAAFQIQMFGFYMSATVIGYGTSSNADENQGILLTFIVPVFSFCVLAASCFYFNRLTVQHVFIRVFGGQFSSTADISSSEQLWSFLKTEKNSSIMNRIHRLRTSDYTGPYPYFFLMYNLGGIMSLFLETHSSMMTGNAAVDKYHVLQVLYLLGSGMFSVWLTAELTSRAWRALDFEVSRNSKEGNVYQVELGELFVELPKAVLAAVAVSVLTDGGDHPEPAKPLVAQEWHKLYCKGIVHQKPGPFAASLLPSRIVST